MQSRKYIARFSRITTNELLPGDAFPIRCSSFFGAAVEFDNQILFAAIFS